MRRSAAVALTAILILPGCAEQERSAPRLAAAPAPEKLTPGNEAAFYLNIVDGLVKDKRHGAALAFLDSYALAQKDPEPRYWLLRGNALLGLNRGEDAGRAFHRLFGTALGGEGWNGMGRVAALQKRWRLAAANFGKAVESEPANSDFLNNLAFAGLHMGQKVQALVWLRQARELDPKSDLIRNNLLIALALNGDRDHAEAVLARIATNTERNHVRALVKSAVANGGWNEGSKS